MPRKRRGGHSNWKRPAKKAKVVTADIVVSHTVADKPGSDEESCCSGTNRPDVSSDKDVYQETPKVQDTIAAVTNISDPVPKIKRARRKGTSGWTKRKGTKHGSSSKKIPEVSQQQQQRNEKSVTVSSEICVIEPTQRPQTQDVHVIRGTISQDNDRYDQISRGRQCTPIAVVALSYNRVLSFSRWTPSTIDDVIDFGDNLYKRSISARFSQNFADTTAHPYLMLTEVYSKFIILNYGFNIIINEISSINGYVGVESPEPFLKLADGLPQVFQNYESAVYTCASLSICIFKSSAAYYLFDSHNRGADGRTVQTGGMACLIKFPNDQLLLRFLLQNYPSAEEYSLTPIDIRVESTDNLADIGTYAVLYRYEALSRPFDQPVITVDNAPTYVGNVDLIVRQADNLVSLIQNASRKGRDDNNRATTVVRGAAKPQPDVPLHYLGAMDIECFHCGALFYRSEKPICCSIGAIRFVNGPDYPDPLKSLIANIHPLSKEFIKHIRRYNTLLAFGSTIATVRQDLGQGAPVVVVSGQIHHRIADVGPANRSFGSLYFLDSGEASRARASNVEVHDGCEPRLLAQIDALLRSINPFAQLYQSLGQLVQDERRTYGNERIPEIGLYFKKVPGTNRNIYAAPSTSSEIGAVFTSVDGSMPPPSEHVRVFFRENRSQFKDIPRTSPIKDALCYPLLFPHGELGWAYDLLRSDRSGRSRVRISQREFYCYRLMVRRPSLNSILLCGKLFQQYVVDKYAEIEGERLHFLRLHQQELRSDSYVGLQDFIARRNETEPVESRRIGRVVILPSTFHNGPRYMQQRYQDAMAIVAKFGRPSLFVTFTCNPQWREIRDNLGSGLLNPQDRPELIARVFDLKRRDFMDDILARKIFGTVIAHVYVIEFQKRGLPHMHLILFLADENKLREPDDVDKHICAELPPNNTRLFDIVTSSMIHGPCGDRCPNSPCMEDGACLKRYPKDYSDCTVIDRRRPIYRRRNDGRTATLIKKGVSYEIDNRDVVPYNPYLSMKYESHINVEVVTSVGAVKYVFKYINKGPDAALLQVRNETVFDEIQAYIDTRYLSAGEAAYRLFKLSTHGMSPRMELLPVHLPGERTITFEEGKEERAIRGQEGKLSRLEAFFVLNENDPVARRYTYTEVPLHYCWVNNKRWQRRVRKHQIVTRMYTISPKYVEKFHLRVLLLHVRGPTSFESLRTYNGIVHGTFQEAARARLLTDSDDEWEKTLEHAALVQMPRCMRKLFAYLLCYCEVGNPLTLWTAFKSYMCEDFRTRGLPQEETERRALRGIETILLFLGRTLRDFGLPECSSDFVVDDDDEEHADGDDPQSDDISEDSALNGLNPEQRDVFDRVIGAVASDTSRRYFYLQGSGGTGKTHLYNVILNYCRKRRIPTIAVAFTGIAALLLRNGRTVHSTFKLPLNMDADSRSSITAQSEEAATLRDLRLIIWDEVSMASYHVLDAVDRLLQDVCMDRRSFGGKCVLLGGDVKQLLPVAVGRVQQIELFFANCKAWNLFEVLRLELNMRADTGEAKFAGWLEDLGHGTTNVDVIDDAGDTVCLPEGCVTQDLLSDIFGQLDALTPEQLATRAILCPRNDHCNRLNDRLLEQFPGPLITLTSSDSVATGDLDEIANYPLEYLNSITPSGMPLHELKIKIGVPLILLRNLCLEDGLINGTRLIVLAATDLLITAKIVTGRFSGRRAFIPRMDLTSTDKTIPIILKRRQFPVKVCFALTINKAQGQTFDKVGIYLGSPVFSHGQLYVAFSRARNWDAVKVQVEETKQQGRLLKYSKSVYTKNIVFGNILKAINY